MFNIQVAVSPGSKLGVRQQQARVTSLLFGKKLWQLIARLQLSLKWVIAKFEPWWQLSLNWVLRHGPRFQSLSTLINGQRTTSSTPNKTTSCSIGIPYCQYNSHSCSIHTRCNLYTATWTLAYNSQRHLSWSVYVGSTCGCTKENSLHFFIVLPALIHKQLHIRLF